MVTVNLALRMSIGKLLGINTVLTVVHIGMVLSGTKRLIVHVIQSVFQGPIKTI